MPEPPHSDDFHLQPRCAARVGSTHAIQQQGEEDLVLSITYPKAPTGAR